MTFLDTQKISEKYKKQECLWGLKPNKYVAQIPKTIKSGTVLDLGVGEGRNALFLVKQGFEVTGIDISKEAVNKLLKFAKKENLDVKGIVLDLVDFEFNHKYDVILSVATLHLVSKDKVIETIRKIKSHTKDKGINLLTVFTKKDIGYKEYPNLYFFNENELKELYKDWQILKYKNYIKEETHGEPHEHHICVLIAKNRGHSSNNSLYNLD
ncbi:MAG: methyltransferase domain-containing protein [Candidatus Aenigmarchaeota archaeon]|nr:methyltransferase domain-containing protein [Candidatus Aenigmarchaeota archaeon]